MTLNYFGMEGVLVRSPCTIRDCEKQYRQCASLKAEANDYPPFQKQCM